MVAKFAYIGGQPKFIIDGTPVDPVAYMTYVPDAQREAEMRDAGMKLFSFTVMTGDMPINEQVNSAPFYKNIWVGRGKYDFTDVDRFLEMAAPGGEGAYIFPRVYLDAPRWWYDENPGECCRDYAGRQLEQSFASDKWREDMREVFRALIDHIHSSPWRDCVIGYHVAFGGTEECVYQFPDYGDEVDFSPACEEKFRQWLREKYKTPDRLREAWKATRFAGIENFDAAQLPTPYERRYSMNGPIRDLAREAHTVDFFCFNSWLIADTIRYFCRFVKEYTHNTRITGAFYGYLYMLFNTAKGHNDNYDLLNCPYIDFVSNAGGGFGLGAPIESYRLHNKFWFAEGDIRTSLSNSLADAMPQVLPPNNSYYERPVWKPLSSMDASVTALRRAMARVLTQHSGIWFFDMWGGWFRCPEMMREISSLSSLMASQTEGPLETQAAFIIDEEGELMYGGVRTHELRCLTSAQRTELYKMGTTVHTYIADDLADPAFDPDRYKVYYILGCVNPSERVRRGIERLKSGGRTLVWVYFSDVLHTGITDFEVPYDQNAPLVQAEVPMRVEDQINVKVSFPDMPLSCPRFSEKDKEGAYVIGYLKEDDRLTREPAVLMKQFPHYRSVMSLLPCLPAKLLRELALFSGANIYCQTDDFTFQGGTYAALSANSEGEKRLSFPVQPKRITDVSTGEEYVTTGIRFFDFIMKSGETKIFKLEF